MIQPHPNENDLLELGHAVAAHKTVLLYLVAHCPLAVPDREDNISWGAGLKKDVELRVDWARTVLHTLFPVKKDNEGAQP